MILYQLTGNTKAIQKQHQVNTLFDDMYKLCEAIGVLNSVINRVHKRYIFPHHRKTLFTL